MFQFFLPATWPEAVYVIREVAVCRWMIAGYLDAALSAEAVSAD